MESVSSVNMCKSSIPHDTDIFINDSELAGDASRLDSIKELSRVPSTAEPIDEIVDLDIAAFASVNVEDSPYHEAKSIFEWGIALPISESVLQSKIKAAFPLMHPNRIKEAVDFLVDKKLFGAANESGSRNQSYFILYRPYRLSPAEDVAGDLYEIPSEDDKDDVVVRPPPRKRKKLVTPKVTIDTTSPQESFNIGQDSAVSFDEFRSEPEIVRPKCSVDEGTRSRIVMYLHRCFDSSNDMTSMADLKRTLASGGDLEDLSESDLLSVLQYLADLNRVFVDGTDIYKI